MTAFDRSSLMEKFRAMAARGEPIIGGGAGTGLSAKCEEAGGIDLIVDLQFRPLPHGRARLARRACSPYGNANAIVDGDGARSAAGGQAHAGARRRQRHRSVPSDAAASSTN